MDKMEGINMALSISGCHSLDESEAVDEATCAIIATKAIPACMVQEGDAKDKCLKDTSVVIREEKAFDAMKACKCQAFQSIRDSLLSVTELLCSSERNPKAWSPTTWLVWFNYAQCYYKPYQCGWWRHNAHVLPKERAGCIFCSQQAFGGHFNSKTKH